MKILPRLKTLFTGQWADLSLEVLAQMAQRWGYEGLELACWGDHFEVSEASEAYCAAKHELLAKHNLRCVAISAHLVGQAICDRIDERHKAILPPRVWGDGEPDGVRRRAANEMIATIRAAKQFGVKVVNGFTGSSIWHLLYSFPPVPPEMIQAGYNDFAARFTPILDVCEECDVDFALEVHPTEIAFDIASAEAAIAAVKGHRRFRFNYDPSHLGYQRVDYVEFIRRFPNRIAHVHMKDAAWRDGAEAGVFGGHTPFHQHRRAWDFKSLGHGNVNFGEIIRALNDIGYTGPLSVEWEDGGMDREFGAQQALRRLQELDFPTSDIQFDAQFAEASKS
jgi:sugar phosphate isomerase/epimerase